jgi:hypothetical protein
VAVRSSIFQVPFAFLPSFYRWRMTSLVAPPCSSWLGFAAAAAAAAEEESASIARLSTLLVGGWTQ